MLVAIPTQSPPNPAIPGIQYLLIEISPDCSNSGFQVKRITTPKEDFNEGKYEAQIRLKLQG